jgi:hypothetical protein
VGAEAPFAREMTFRYDGRRNETLQSAIQDGCLLATRSASGPRDDAKQGETARGGE